VKGAGKQPNPQIKLSLSRGTVQEDANALSQTFEIAGQPSLRKQIASSLHEQAAQESLVISREVAQEALSAYYEVWLARRSLEISAVNHHLSLGLENIAQQRLAAGQVSQDEYRQARLQLLSALAELQQEVARALAAEENFRALVSYPEDESLHLPGGPKPPPLDHLELPKKTELSARIEQLPQVEIADARARQAKFEADLAGKAGSPDLYLYAYRGTFAPVASTGIQVGVSFPLFDWGSLGAEHSQKKLLAKSRLEEAESSRRTLKAEFLKALELCRGQIQYVQLLEQQFEEREMLAHHSLMAYDLGLITLLEATAAQRNYQIALSQLAREAVSLETQRVSLHLAAGGPLSDITKETL
jgi:outer membrane protein TolC